MDESQIELYRKIDKDSGFFVDKDYFYYAQVNESNIDHQELSTALINMMTNVYVKSISNDPTFISGRYNILAYKGEMDCANFYSFIRLCEVFSKNKSNFLEFFYSLMDLFEVTSSQNYLNTIGLFGELSLMLYLFEKYNINVEPYWHNVNSRDRYDFAFDYSQLEVKTTVKDNSIIHIKHEQLFGKSNTYLAVVNINNDNSGISTEKLVEKLSNSLNLNDNLQFWIKITREQARIKELDFKESKFECKNVSIYNANDIKWIENIPDEISNVEYCYDLVNRNKLTTNEISKYFNEQILASKINDD